MEKKEKLIIMILFGLSLSAILPNVLGQTIYTCEVKEGDEFIYTVTLNTFSLMGSSLGDKHKINITDITEESDYFEVKYNSWDWISEGESFNSTADDSYWTNLYRDPSNVHMGDPFYFVLTPVSDYLDAFAEANYGYSSSGIKLYESFELFLYTYTYDVNGVLLKYEAATGITEAEPGGTVVYVLFRTGSSSGIPGYDLPILIGLTTIAGVSILYIVKKKLLKGSGNDNRNRKTR